MACVSVTMKSILGSLRILVVAPQIYYAGAVAVPPQHQFRLGLGA